MSSEAQEAAPPVETERKRDVEAETAAAVAQALAANKRKPPPLPATVEELKAARILKREMTINDFVEQIHVALWAVPEYQKRFAAIWDSESDEGSCMIDHFYAADAIRSYARKHSYREVGRQNLKTIELALGVVRRRYNLSLRQRRNILGGEIVRGDE